MLILQRYVLKEHIGPFFFALFVVMFILVIDLILQLLDLLIGKGVSVWIIFRLFYLNLAWMVALAVPMAVLVAVLMAFGRLSEDNEITAIRGSGVSFYKLITPVILTSAVIAVLLMIFNEKVLPESNYRARMLISAIHRKKPSIALKDMEGLLIDEFPGYIMKVERVDSRRSELHNVKIWQRGKDLPPLEITAKTGKMKLSEDGDRLTLTLYDGEIHRVDTQDPNLYLRTSFKKHVINITGVGQKLRLDEGSSYRGDREMSSPMMLKIIKGYRKDIEESRRRINLKVKEYIERYLPISGKAPAPYPSPSVSPLAEIDQLISYLEVETSRIRARRQGINRYLVEIHKKYSIPVACVVFVLIGAPLGAMAGRGGMATGFGFSVGFFLIYWAFLIGGEELADRMVVPPVLAMWAPNILIGGAGIYLTIRVVREMTLIRWERFPFLKKRIKEE